MARYRPQRPRPRPRPGGSGYGPPLCQKTRAAWDLRFTQEAEDFIAANMTRGALDLFIDSHFKQLPGFIPHEFSLSSFLRSGGVAHLQITTWCDQGRLQGLVEVPRRGAG